MKKEEDRLRVLSEAVSRATADALMPFETARLMELLPFEIRKDPDVYGRALMLAGEKDLSPYACRETESYLAENDLYVAEGFLRFRLPLVMESWAAAVDRAGEEYAAESEAKELLRILDEDCPLPENESTVRLILYGDDSCVLSDGESVRVESTSSKTGLVLPMLMGLRPELLTVYDLSGGKTGGLLHSILSLFGDRTCIFIIND
ncbi:MAG: putative sporulation protein YtxC [Clostridiales bacterium]|nr:putative sporulation protein YtxC [Clostridiales bacterium]